jgi:hypothetical protein
MDTLKLVISSENKFVKSLIEEFNKHGLNKESVVSRLNVSNVVKVSVGLVGSYVVFKTIKIYLTRRKYRHIPGPGTNG